MAVPGATPGGGRGSVLEDADLSVVSEEGGALPDTAETRLVLGAFHGDTSAVLAALAEGVDVDVLDNEGACTGGCSIAVRARFASAGERVCDATMWPPSPRPVLATRSSTGRRLPTTHPAPLPSPPLPCPALPSPPLPSHSVPRAQAPRR